MWGLIHIFKKKYQYYFGQSKKMLYHCNKGKKNKKNILKK